ncbi:MAG: hypothetical protein JSW61_07920 [Candidatus Thorarchaeota archaeon]|nr:MAG: hypothetical protein JSW61_07920 [Candidatus Thorarchaeota archaeon]
MELIQSSRESARIRIESDRRLDLLLHRFVLSVLLFDVLLIIYTVISISVRMTLARNGFLESLPLALYVIPLIVIIPILLRGYNEKRAAIFPFIIMLISVLILGVLSSLVRGFIIVLLANAFCGAIVVIVGRFRIPGSKRELGRKGVAWLIFLNVIGLLFPISIVIMGQTPIASAHPGAIPEITLDVPLSDFEFPYTEFSPTTEIVKSVSNNSLGLSFRLNVAESAAWLRLTDWFSVLNDSQIPCTIVLSPSRPHIVEADSANLGTTLLIQDVFDELKNSTEVLHAVIDECNRSQISHRVLYDMTLSLNEWQYLMSQARQINIAGFSGLMRNTFDSIDDSVILYESELLAESAESFGFTTGILVDPFILDDYQDLDTIFMKSNALTVESLSLWDTIQVRCSRSFFSHEMDGDVGEYLVHSYSSTIGGLEGTWEMRIAQAGNITDVFGRLNLVYTTLAQLAGDIMIASGNGVQNITIESLPGLVSGFGDGSIDELISLLENHSDVPITYTFRIYAFRAVLIAIDAFDPIMF